MRWRHLRDEFADVFVEIGARRARAALLIIGVALSTGVLVASLTVSSIAARQIDANVAAAASRTFTVGLREGVGADAPPFPVDSDDRASRVPLVVAAGRRVDLAGSDVSVHRLRPGPGAGRTESSANVSAVTSGYLRAAGITIDAPVGFLLDSPRPYAVALLGAGAARELGVPDRGPYVGVRIWLNAQPYAVIGLLSDGQAVGLDDAVVVPHARADALAVVAPIDTILLVRTDIGAAAPVARVIRDAIRPEAPETLTVSSVDDFRELRTGVSDQLALLSAGVGALLLALAMLLIANAMVVAVVSRTGEIGLRRALGASRAAVARIFLIEGGLAGGLGGLAGAAVGVFAALAVAAVNGWGFSFPTLLVLAAPVLGTGVGVLASAYPAWRAAGIAPAEALRSD